MKLTKEQVQHVAGLARLRLKDVEAEGYRETLGKVLGYVAKLDEVDVEGVEEMEHVESLVNVLRDDVAEPVDGGVRQALVESFPRREGDLLKVNAVFDIKDEE